MSTSWISDLSNNIKLLAINYLILNLHYITLFYNQVLQVLLLKSLFMQKRLHAKKKKKKNRCNEVILMKWS